MLEVRNISKSFGHLTILNDISLTVNDGEVVAVTGPSGAGKTTLLQIMGTLDSPDKGIIRYGDINVTELGDNELSHFRNRSLGFVFQMHQLLPEFTLLENVLMPAWIAGKRGTKTKEKAIGLLTEVGLRDRMDHKPSQMSGGECQRGAVARALMNDPQLILADEPTGNLDSRNSLELSQLFFDMRHNHGCTIVIVTHDNSLAQRCDRILYIADGKIS